MYVTSEIEVLKNANATKQSILEYLLRHGFIKDEKILDLEKIVVLTVKKGWLGSIVDKFLGITASDNNLDIRVVSINK
jgi:hypothetical protein